MGLRLDARETVLEDVVARASRRKECAESEARLLCQAERLADIARRLAPIVGVAVAVIVVVAGGFPGSASIWLSGAFAGMLVAVGLL